MANKDEDSIVHPVDLLAEAANRALDDAGVGRSGVGAVLCTPLSSLTDEDASEMLAARLDLVPGIRQVSSYSGAAPQQLLAEACRLVQEGQADVVLVAGGIADASVRRARRNGLEPLAAPTSTWSQGSEGLQSAVAAAGGRVLPPSPERYAGAGLPSSYFALVHSSLTAGTDVVTERKRLGSLLAPFTGVAASRPDLAWFPVERTADDISEVSPENRLVAEPYTKLMCSFPTVDLAAALVVSASSGRASSGTTLVRPLALTSAKEASSPAGWEVMHRPVALARAVEAAMTLAGTEPGQADWFDLYSCFPAAVLLECAALGLADDDPRGLTVTGGLPYFGGPGASYSLHALAAMTERLRVKPGTAGVVVSVGGMVNSFSVGVYSSGDQPYPDQQYASRVIPPDPAPAVPTRKVAEGPALVDAMTVLHDRERGPVAAPVVARLPDGSRVGARAASARLAADLAGTSLVGEAVVLKESNGKVSYQPAGG